MTMTNDPRTSENLAGCCPAMLRRFAREEDGLVTLFAILMILLMILLGGVGVDLMRHERERARVQAVADRAVRAGRLHFKRHGRGRSELPPCYG